MRNTFTTIAACLLSGGLALAQTPTWDVTFVGALPAGWSPPALAALNDLGVVVGNTQVDLLQRPWVGVPGQGLSLLPLPADTSFAAVTDVNAAGQIVGQILATGAFAARGALWQPVPGGYDVQLLPADAGGRLPVDARAINDRGDVVGKFLIGGNYHWSAATGTTHLVDFVEVPADVNEARQVVGGTLRMDLDDLLVENLGSPTGTSFGFLFSQLGSINDAGQCAGYGNTASSQSANKLPILFTPGEGWTIYSNFPLVAAGVPGLAATGDLVYHLGIFGTYLSVDGHGSLGLGDLLDPLAADWSLVTSVVPVLSRGGRLATFGGNATSGESGLVLLEPAHFADLGGAAPGALGTPVLGAYGAPAAGAPVRLRLASAAPDSTAWLVVALDSLPLPKLGGILYAAPPLVILPVPTTALGRVDLGFAWPDLPAGSEVLIQAAVTDAQASAPFTLSLSNALRTVTL